jgi:oligoribonuclease (3'-5' exoribonuclease)
MISTYDTIAWVDTETTGLNASSCQVIDLAVVITDQEGNILDSYEAKLKLTEAAKAAAAVPGSSTAEALSVNKYNEAEWADAVPSDRAVWQRVYKMTAKRNLGGQNTAFDAAFLTAEMARFGIQPRWVRRLLDTTSYATIAMNHFGVTNAKGIPTANLQAVYEAMQGPVLPAHRAMGDVLRCIYLYKFFRTAFINMLPVRATYGFPEHGQDVQWSGADSALSPTDAREFAESLRRDAEEGVVIVSPEPLAAVTISADDFVKQGVLPGDVGSSEGELYLSEDPTRWKRALSAFEPGAPLTEDEQAAARGGVSKEMWDKGYVASGTDHVAEKATDR